MDNEIADSGINGEQNSVIVPCDTNDSIKDIESEIKQEDPIDIDDTPQIDFTKFLPIISLTPTSKLLAIPNPTDPKRKFVCPYDECDKSYGKSSHLRSHMTWHTGIKPFVCQEPNCRKGFTRSDELNRHVRTHTGEKPFECMQCTKKFSRSDHLTKHLATHEKQQKTKKRNSDKAKITTTTLTRGKKKLAEAAEFGGHVMTVTPGEESKMDNTQTLAPKDLFNINLQPKENPEEVKNNSFIHLPIKIKLERPENSSEYQIVPTSISRNESIVDDTNSELIVGDNEVVPEPSAPPALSLDVSIKNEPEDTESEQPSHDEHSFETMHSETDLECHRNELSEECDLQSMILTRLEVGPTNERPFHCTECIRSFRRQDDLQRHMRTHTGEKPYPCTKCDRRFVRSDHLKKHMQTHTRSR